jgi:ACS family sodium-dependent inorganic phosphate cotransporter
MSALPRRHVVVGLAALSVFVCYIDRVNISVAIIPMTEDLGWSLATQGTVLSSFFVGYLLLQIVGGRLADRFGGKVVLGVGVLVWSLFTVLTPPAAYLGLGVLIAARIGMGMGEAVTFPSIYSLYGRWVPLSERARAVGFTNSGIPLGTVFALVATPYIVEWLGWEWAFYLFGAVGVFWFVAWHRFVTAAPQAHPGVCDDELQVIEAGTQVAQAGESPPLRVFLKLPAVWAIVVAHFCNNWSLYVLLSWLPTFVNKGLGVDYSAVGWFTMIPHLTAFVFLNVAGGVMSVGNALGAFCTGGFAVNHMDIAPRHAGTLMGITNTAGTLPGIVGVFVSGVILELTGSWALVFQVAAGVNLFGLVFYLTFASGRRLID